MTKGSQPLLAVVVIARNEATHIAMCLDATLKAIAPYPGTPVILVDSDSTDDTVQIATSFPIDVYRYRAGIRTAAAGRWIGAKLVEADYLLFVDGDCEIETAWLPVALTCLQQRPDVAVVYGQRREVYEGVPPGYASAAAPDEATLGGNALYRAAALHAVGGFHPFLASEEEAELLARLHGAAYTAAVTPDLMITHYTIPKDTWRGHLRRIGRRMTIGPGQVLRSAIPQGLFGYHARRLNRLLLMLTYLAAGLACGVADLAGAPAWLAWGWLVVGVVAFVVLWYRRGDLRSTTYIATDWVLGAIGVVVGFLLALPLPRSFDPVVERVQHSASSSEPAILPERWRGSWVTGALASNATAHQRSQS